MGEAHHGMNRKDAHALIKAIGGEIELIDGEFRYRHSLMAKPVTGDNRKKDVGRHVSKWLIDLEKKLGR